MQTQLEPKWPAFIDGALDGGIVAFAGWTIFYQFGLVFQFSMLWAGWPWLAVAVTCVVGGGLLRSRCERSDESHSEPQPRTRPLSTKFLLAGLGIVVVLVVGREMWGVWPVALVAIVLLVMQVVPSLRYRTTVNSEVSTSSVGWPAHVAALSMSIGFGVLGLFLLRPDEDDVFYVNRATWVAKFGTAATNDTMFGPNDLPPSYSGGLLTPSIEALQGVVAHTLGVQAPTLCYLLAVPVLGAAAGWTAWRLIRAWAPNKHVLVMVVTMLFLIASGDSVVGGYSLGRIWQGKATAYLILIPLAWLFLTRAARCVRRADLALLVAVGIAFVGLTTTSALLAPVIAGAAFVAALILRSKSLALAAAAFLLGPFINGVAQAVGPAAIGGGGDNAISTPENAFAIAFGSGAVMILLGLIALVMVPRLVPGNVGVILASGAVCTLVALLPGVFQVADAVTGAGAVAWRLVIAMPIWVLVGLLATIAPVSGSHKKHSGNRSAVGSVAIASVLVAVPLVFGTMLWNAPGASLTSRPTWKVNQVALSDVRAVQERTSDTGLWLLPPAQMQILAISTVGPFSVVPRHYYLPGLKVSEEDRTNRSLLFQVAAGELKLSPARVREAINQLGVTVACVPVSATDDQRVLRRALRSKLKVVGQLKCGGL